MKPPVLYYGGKGSTAERIVALMPPHEVYVEPFAGSLAVLLAKPPARMEVVNDLDRDLVTFWRVLRDRPDDLQRVVDLTPHARAELDAAHNREGIDDLERARRVWVVLTQGRSARLAGSTGWKHWYSLGTPDARGPAPFAQYMDAYRRRIPPAAARIADVSLECRDALDVISEYGKAPGTLLYVDPPYLASTRNGRGYVHEFETVADHERLAAALHECRATVVLSGYSSDLYERLYAEWSRHDLSAHSATATRARERVEVVWINRDSGGGLW